MPTLGGPHHHRARRRGGQCRLRRFPRPNGRRGAGPKRTRRRRPRRLHRHRTNPDPGLRPSARTGARQRRASNVRRL
ncbi:hypothetical protein FZ046_03595 [Mycolicibacterium grossiae]|nr:hypothetical protein FZ046_03585 [Mycolicibacterium grossiae]QEM43989.1 hypothetical protein FZ046_03595 [Mycolicibacterium grossiae]